MELRLTTAAPADEVLRTHLVCQFAKTMIALSVTLTAWISISCRPR